MKKNKDDFYYDNLQICVDYSYQAVAFLIELLHKFDKTDLENNLDQMHHWEQSADSKKHEMQTALSKAFITPIEREDLVSLSGNLDDIMDAIEDILLQLYMSNVPRIRPDIFPMLELVKKGVQKLSSILKEMKDFRHSKKIEEYIIQVNDLEEQCDQLYVKTMHRLHLENNITEVMIWRTIYDSVEKCMDLCEHTADIVTTIILKNS